MTPLIPLIETLKTKHMLNTDEWMTLLDGLMEDAEASAYLQKEAQKISQLQAFQTFHS